MTATRNRIIAILIGIVFVIAMTTVVSTDPAFAASKKKLSKCKVTLSYTSTTYNGKIKKPTVKVKYKGKKVSKKNYKVTYSNPEAVDPGKYTVTVTGKKKFKGKVKKTFKIKVGNPSSLKAVYNGNETVDENSSIDVTWKAAKKSSGYVINVKKDGETFGESPYTTQETSLKLTDLGGPGKFSIKVKSVAGPKDTLSSGKSKEVYAGYLEQKITTKKSAYTGAVHASVLLKAKAKTKMTYKSSNKKVATVDSKGKLTLKGTGTATITIKAPQDVVDGTHYLAAKTKKVTIKATEYPVVGEASSGDHSASGGANVAGDQAGNEVRVCKWYYSSNKSSYSHWTYVLRFKDPAMAETAASVMEAVCNNDHIGYDNATQSKRIKKVFNAAVENGWDCSKISTDCDTACSQLVSLCVKAAAYRDDPETGYKWCDVNASAMFRKLAKTGLFDVYRNAKNTDYKGSYETKYVTGGIAGSLDLSVNSYLQRGDILVTNHDAVSAGGNNHTCMVLYVPEKFRKDPPVAPTEPTEPAPSDPSSETSGN